MEVTVIATMIIQVLSPYFVKAGEEVASAVGQTAWHKVTELYQLIKSRFGKEESDYPSQTLDQFESNPEKRRAAMQEILEEILEKDQEFANAISNLLDDDEGASQSRPVFNTTISGSTVGEVLNIDRLEGGLTINKQN